MSLQMNSWAKSAAMFVLVCCTGLAGRLNAQNAIKTEQSTTPGWPDRIQKITYLSQADGTMQPALYYDPGGAEPKPLLVALHSWSGNYQQPNGAYGAWCIAKKWVMIHPDFRGVNEKPEACGSELVVQDILSAVDFAKKHSSVDETRIYLMGGSGGGYASLLMAGRAPDIWAAVSAWCPIYDLKAWHRETAERKLRYSAMLEKVCGGSPGISQTVDEQYRLRSASNWLSNAGKVNLSINTGITDGHNGSVPVGHSLRAFNSVAAPEHRISEDAIESIERQPELPEGLKGPIEDLLFVKKKALFQKRSTNVQVTLFQGGHEILYDAGLNWLEYQRRGKPPIWNIPATSAVDLGTKETQSGK